VDKIQTTTKDKTKMTQPQLFLFGLAILTFTLIGTITYLNAKKQEIQNETQDIIRHYTNWGNQ